MYKIILLAFAVLLLASCATMPTRFPVTDPVDRDFIASVWQDSLEFNLPEGQGADIAWQRAQVFVTRFGAPIARSTSYSITTYPSQFYASEGSVVSVAYTVTRLRENGRVYFTVSGWAKGDTNADRLNVHMLSRYMRTGELFPWLLCRDIEISNIINPYNQ